MKTFIGALVISGMFAWLCCAQEANTRKAGASNDVNSDPSIADQATYYATLNRRAIEYKAQSELLNQLAQEHRKRGEQAPPDQTAKAQWEMELAKELGERSSALLEGLSNNRKERLAFEQSHPDVAAAVPRNSAVGAVNASNADEIAFTGKLEERLAAVQLEIADSIEAGKVYTAQLRTNTASYDYSRIASLLQENNSAVRQLQKEASDLELKKLEFRALRRD